MTKTRKAFTNNNKQDLEELIKTYYSAYSAEPAYKLTLINQLHSEIISVSARKNRESTSMRMFPNPVLKWVAGGLAFVVLFLSILAINPVREAIGKALDIGYLEGIGFVRISETKVLNGTINSDRISQAIGIDQVVINPSGTTILFHSTGERLIFTATKGDPISYIEIDNINYPVNAWSWDEDNQKGILDFSTTTPTMPSTFILHIAPDWSIPIQVIPMSESDTVQVVTIYPDLCQTQSGIELCIQAFMANTTGYHLLLNASSLNPDNYLETITVTNPLTGEGAVLMDSSGNSLHENNSSTPSFPIPHETPYGNMDSLNEVSTSLSFSLPPQEGEILTLLVSGFTVKTPVNKTISCDVGDDLVVGSTFPCERSITIGANELSFHSGEILQGQNGIRLMLVSDPLISTHEMILTGVDFENLNGVSPLMGSSFNVQTRQLSLWLEQDSANIDRSFGIRITHGYLTIEESFQFTWDIRP